MEPRIRKMAFTVDSSSYSDLYFLKLIITLREALLLNRYQLHRQTESDR